MVQEKMKTKRQYLLVDDDATSNLISTLSIKKLDPQAQIYSFTVPEEALANVRSICIPEETACVLFLDVNMPSMTAWEFLDEFEEICPLIRSEITIYILTSSIEDFSEQKKRYPWVRAFLTKPLKRDKLEKIIQEVTFLTTSEKVDL